MAPTSSGVAEILASLCPRPAVPSLSSRLCPPAQPSQLTGRTTRSSTLLRARSSSYLRTAAKPSRRRRATLARPRHRSRSLSTRRVLVMRGSLRIKVSSILRTLVRASLLPLALPRYAFFRSTRHVSSYSILTGVGHRTWRSRKHEQLPRSIRSSGPQRQRGGYRVLPLGQRGRELGENQRCQPRLRLR